MTVWYAGRNETPPWIPDSHLCRVTNNRCKRYGIFSWWWAHSCPKHVEKSNKVIKKICAPSWFYSQDFTGMHGQQNMKLRLCVYILASVIQHQTRMRRITLSSVARLAVPYSSTLSHKKHLHRKKVIVHKMCAFVFPANIVWNISYSKNNSARYEQKYRLIHKSLRDFRPFILNFPSALSLFTA